MMDFQVDVGDLDGDGDVDVVSIGTSPTNNVVWYENKKWGCLRVGQSAQTC